MTIDNHCRCGHFDYQHTKELHACSECSCDGYDEFRQNDGTITARVARPDDFDQITAGLPTKPLGSNLDEPITLSPEAQKAYDESEW